MSSLCLRAGQPSGPILLAQGPSQAPVTPQPASPPGGQGCTVPHTSACRPHTPHSVPAPPSVRVASLHVDLYSFIKPILAVFFVRLLLFLCIFEFFLFPACTFFWPMNMFKWNSLNKQKVMGSSQPAVFSSLCF